MKTVSFITIHVGFNFGSVLQSIATAEVIKKVGGSPLLINYVPSRVTYRRYFKNIKSLICLLKKILMFPNFILNKYVYFSYLKKYCKLSRCIYDGDDFFALCPKSDIYLVGSDQVWNSTYNEGVNKRYFFDGFPDNTQKISFASSFGKTKLDEVEFDEIKQMLQSFKAISVREKSAKNLLDKMGIRSTQVLAPTFMLKGEEWKNFMSKRLVNEDYILVYLPYNIIDKELIYHSVRRISRRKNLKVVAFSWDFHKDRYADKTMYYSSPGDFLSLMYNASFVMTNSFHGTAFSVNLNKQFFVYHPSGFSTRILSILELTGLEYRLLSDLITDEQIEKVIDYVPVNQILNIERENALYFLRKSMS